MANAVKRRLGIMFAEQKQIEFFVKVPELLQDFDKVLESNPVEIEGIQWRLQARAKLKESAKLLTISLACTIAWPDCVYASASLETVPGGHITDRFDSSHQAAEIGTFPVPTIRKSEHPVRSVKVVVKIRAEPPSALTSFEAQIKAVGLSDVVLEVQDHKLHVNRVILATASPVFRSMFFGHFSEAEVQSLSDTELKVIKLPDKDLSLFLEMLCTIYPPQLEINSARAKFLLPLYMEYQMSHMVTKCEHILCQADIYDTSDGKEQSKSNSHLDEAMDHLLLCSLYEMSRLQELAVAAVARRRSHDFENHDVYGSLSLEVKNQVYQSRVHLLENPSDAERASTPNQGR